ncbi:alpha-hydroxy acid oxidase [Variovorax sp. J22G21]|uniref:alpha-hydroxy acid oxidase n=1 Tax=Variovorax fucosicus TaxID=3053517 RepID=UPI002578F145|nr:MULTISPECIES: alpha-hydroxy acid oxidase [unclassified Variovorax]MDM0039667.1 alpha-hydroxy acid oxidase [Variovorax sp. J22R193]MDM0064442.1 alpha-hydroxy acid oxidase [Variovorax sp. J22G21]
MNSPRQQSGPAPNARRHLPASLRPILSLGDLEPAARSRLPRLLFGYLSGGVEDNVSLDANMAAFRRWMFRTNVLVNVSDRQQRTQLMGMEYQAPFGIAPMGLCALFAFNGDVVMAEAAEAAGIPYVLSGASLTRMEEVAQAAPTCGWFQAYIPGDPAHIEGLLERVMAAGFKTLVVTVDTATLANRENNVRVGFATPLRPSVRLAWDGLTRPRWLLGTLAKTLLQRGMPHFENASAQRGVPIISSGVVRQFGLRDHLSWEHLALIRRSWPGKLVVKGLSAADDVRRAEQAGADGVILSNHGGRQLDGTMPPLLALPEAARAKGGMALMLDSGVRRGTDVLKALALGADHVFVGRPMAYAAALAGRAGVAHAITLLRDEVHRDMALLGVNRLDDLGPARLVQV